ncbi:MAG: homoserine kinase [Tenericutes bacterium]|jgi:homoserine kinase|nr:homoserine kinase [Mycoplasmatota bacterium]
MLKIKTPATSGNISVGFDAAGMAFNIYNTFLFSESKENQLSGFLDEFKDNNLVLKAYRDCALKFIEDKAIKNVHIELKQNDVPYARGMGSSATCILAGVIASNHMNQLGLTFKNCVNIACELGGHLDNVYACAYGGLTIAFKDHDDYLYQTTKVNEQLNFYLLIPNALGQTKQLRNLLPKRVLMEDAIFNLSRIGFLPKAIEDGDFLTLKKVIKDRLHEPYRYHTLPLYDDIKTLSKRDDLIVSISGSGPTVLLISKDENIHIPDKLKKFYQLTPVKVSDGTTIEVLT